VSSSNEPVSVILAELEKVLREEHRALRVLDHAAIERASEQKLLLDERLRAAEANKTAADLPALQRVKRLALDNQLLIVHARACLQSIIGMVTGENFTTYPGTAAKRSVPAPFRLNVRV
jgi:hypothetical protein